MRALRLTRKLTRSPRNTAMQLTLQLWLPEFKAGPDCYPALYARISTVEAWHPQSANLSSKAKL